MTRTIEELEARLREAEELLNAIRSGEVDALVVSGPRGDRVYTLTGAEHPYRIMVEAMNEGAVTLTADGMIVYSNSSFARMVGLPLDQVCGTAMDRHVLPEDLGCYEELLKHVGGEAARGNIRLVAGGGMTVPVHLSIASFEAGGCGGLCAIVTDLGAHQLHQALVAAEALERVKRTEAESGQRRIAKILESITDSFFSLDRMWRMLDANERAAANFGMSRDQMLGKTFWELSPPGVVPELDEHFRRAMHDRVPVHFEGPSAAAPGKWFERHIYPTDEGVAVYFRDVSMRKRVERELQRSEANLGEAQKLSHTGSWTWNVATGECVWSLEHFRIFGLDPDSFRPTKDNTQRLIHPDDLPCVEQTLERSIRDMSGFEVDYRFLHPDGTVRYHHGVGHPTVNESGELECVGSVVDVTDWRLAQERLHRSQSLLADGQRISHTGSWVLNLITRDLAWSDEHFRIWGVDPADFDLTIDSVFQFVHPDDRLATEREFQEAVARRSDFKREFRIVRADGTIRHVLSVGRPRVGQTGDLTEYMGTIVDITDRKHDDAERRDLHRRLAISQEDERRRIARELHDEFGQQLSALALRLAQLKRDVGRRSGLAEQLAALEVLTRQLDQELEHIIWRLRPTALDDLGLVAALENYIGQWAAQSGVECALHANGGEMGEMTSEIETALYRIAQEALNNVARHARARNATVLLDRSAGRVSLIVEDDGIGFDVAQQLGLRQRFGVTGMRERALLLGGEFDIESTSGKGTTVVARIPLPPRLEEAGDDSGSDRLGRGPQSHARGSADDSRPRNRPGSRRGS
jgi:PAS domain S-box-containing protein